MWCAHGTLKWLDFIEIGLLKDIEIKNFENPVVNYACLIFGLNLPLKYFDFLTYKKDCMILVFKNNV